MPCLTQLVLYGTEEVRERAAGALWNIGRARASEGRGAPAAADAWRHLEVSGMLEGAGVSKADAERVRGIANRKLLISSLRLKMRKAARLLYFRSTVTPENTARVKCGLLLVTTVV